MPHRAVQALTQVARDYPGCWQTLDQLISDVRAAGVTWPDWCWAPMAASYTVVSGGEKLPINDSRARDVSRLAALSAWRTTQGIYRFDPTLLEELWGSSVDGALPVETLMHLPEWCVYVETPGRSVLHGVAINGFWAHLEHDSPDDDSRKPRVELRLLLDTDQPPLVPIPLHLGRGRGTLTDAAQGAQDEALANAALGGDVTLAAVLHETPLPVAYATVEPLISVLLYLCTSAEALRSEDGREPSHPSPRPGRRGEAPRYYPPASPATYPTGVRLGASLRSARAATAAATESSGDGKAPVPHVRRAHWHTFLLGPRAEERRREVRWLHPILVGARRQGESELPAVVHRVPEETTGAS